MVYFRFCKELSLVSDKNSQNEGIIYLETVNWTLKSVINNFLRQRQGTKVFFLLHIFTIKEYIHKWWTFYIYNF